MSRTGQMRGKSSKAGKEIAPPHPAQRATLSLEVEGA